MALNTKDKLIVKMRQVITPESFLDTKGVRAFDQDLINDFITQNIFLKPMAKPRPMTDSPDGLENVKEKNMEIYKYYKVDAPEERLPELMNQLNKMEAVEVAYIKPPAIPASVRLNRMTPATFATLPATVADFRDRQNYLDASPAGINVEHAWSLAGGKGAGVRIIDIENSWRFTHEDLLLNQGGLIAGPNATNDNHGTAVLGIFSADDNGFGVVGISPDANVSGISLEEEFDTSEAIRLAADKLRAGDIILIEVHRAGPLNTDRENDFGYIGIEWWPCDFEAIRYATQKGIVVVEAAGNGGQDLNNPIYNIRPNNIPGCGSFPENWRNPFNMANPQSGAVLVGAGLPPAGTHERDFEPNSGDIYQDRGRCFFSNFGDRVDAQGWGWEVTTTGYGDLQGGIDRDAWYTDKFSGTSSASPIIVGTLACLQGILKAKGRRPLRSEEAIALLRNSGSQQEDAPSFTFVPNMAGSGYPQHHPFRPHTQRIGNRPDLQQLISLLNINDLS